MNAASLTTPVIIMRNEAISDALGSTSANWKEVARRRAHVISQKGGRAFNNGSVWYPTARVVKLRKPLDIDESYRLVIDGVDYEIISIDRLAKDSITINCQRVYDCSL